MYLHLHVHTYINKYIQQLVINDFNLGASVDMNNREGVEQMHYTRVNRTDPLSSCDKDDLL